MMQYIVGPFLLIIFIAILVMHILIYRRLGRIATGDFLKEPINSYGEGIGDAIQGQINRGNAGVSQYDR